MTRVRARAYWSENATFVDHVIVLGLGIKGKAPVTRAASGEAQGRPWSGQGIALPHGTQLRMEYNGKTHSGYGGLSGDKLHQRSGRRRKAA